MQVEDVAGVGLAARRATQQQRHCAVGLGLLGEIIEHDEHVLAVVHPVLSDCRTGVRREVLEAGRIRCRGGNDGCVLQCAVLLERALDRRDGRALLSDGNVDAAHLLRGIPRQPVLALVEDRVEAHGGLAGLAVANDELTLAAADGGHGVDCLDTGEHRLFDGLALHDRGSLDFQSAASLRRNGAKSVDRVAQGIDDAAEVGVTHGNREDLARATHSLTFLDLRAVTEEHDADLPDIEVQGQPEQASLELQQLIGHRRVQALDASDAVTCLDDATDLFASGLRRVRRDVPLDRIPDLLRPDRQLRHGMCPLPGVCGSYVGGVCGGRWVSAE